MPLDMEGCSGRLSLPHPHLSFPSSPFSLIFIPPLLTTHSPPPHSPPSAQVFLNRLKEDHPDDFEVEADDVFCIDIAMATGSAKLRQGDVKPSGTKRGWHLDAYAKRERCCDGCAAGVSLGLNSFKLKGLVPPPNLRA